ncbi:hypothetical protein NO2_0568 [Candidatus Termititenax persephonae]|uniref:Uncharacterized protein n=1 Tax=Candidatus Termititenax persephonae TaxID=2218525 RepID=A0A388TFU4_9BACT|nr:hypothetical protein NO2_0568 [Candidatus Termititenax persephonae]
MGTMWHNKNYAVSRENPRLGTAPGWPPKGQPPYGLLAIGAAGLGLAMTGCREDHAPQGNIKVKEEIENIPPYTYSDPDTPPDILSKVLATETDYQWGEGTVPTVYQKFLYGLRGFWRNSWLDDSRRNGLLRRTKYTQGSQPAMDVYFVRQTVDDKYAPDNPTRRTYLSDLIVSESVYWLRTAAGIHYAGVSVRESQDLFNKMLTGFGLMADLDDKGAFPAWRVRAVYDSDTANGLALKELVLDDSDPELDASNSASDADHDLVRALLAAVDNVRRGYWTEDATTKVEWRGQKYTYAELLDLLIPALKKEYILLPGSKDIYIMKPSEDDYEATETEKDVRLDYLSPGTCFAIAEHLKNKSPAENSLGEWWADRGQDSMKIYLACLDAHGYVPEKSWVTYTDDGQIKIEANGRQGYDGIRAPERIADGLRYPQYFTLDDGQRQILQNYLARYSEGYTVPQQDAAAYLPLAVQLGETAAAQTIAKKAAEGMSRQSVYGDSASYFETAYIAATLINTLYPYNPQAVYRGKINESAPQELVKLGLPGKYYLESGGYGLVFNNKTDDVAGYHFNDFLPTGWQLLTSEAVAYDLDISLYYYNHPEQHPDRQTKPPKTSKKVQEEMEQRISALVRTLIMATAQNHYETDTYTRQMPWAIMTNGQEYRVVQQPGFDGFGNATASDADLKILARLIKVKDFKLFKETELDFMISQLALDFIQQDTVSYRDSDGTPRRFMNSGAYRSAAEDLNTGEILHEFHTSYYDQYDLQLVSEYFRRPRPQDSNFKVGDDYLEQSFAMLAEDSKRLLEQIKEVFRFNENYQNFPDKLYLCVSERGLRILKVLDIEIPPGNDPDKPEYRQKGGGGADDDGDGVLNKYDQGSPAYYLKGGEGYKQEEAIMEWWQYDAQKGEMVLAASSTSIQDYLDFYRYYQSAPDQYQIAIRRLALSGEDTPQGDLRKLLEQDRDDDDYYRYYLTAMYEARREQGERTDFYSTSRRYSLDNTLYQHDGWEMFDVVRKAFPWFPGSSLQNTFYPNKGRRKDASSPLVINNMHNAGNANNPLDMYNILQPETPGWRLDSSLTVNSALNSAILFSSSDDTILKSLGLYRRVLYLTMLDNSLLLGPDTLINLAPKTKLDGELARLSKETPGSVYIVQGFVDILTKRGYSESRIVEELNQLLSAALRARADRGDSKEDVQANLVVRALYFQKLLLWDFLSMSDCQELEALAAELGWVYPIDKTTGQPATPQTPPENVLEVGIFNRLKNPPTNERDPRRLVLDWEGRHLDTQAKDATGEYVLTPRSLEDRGSPWVRLPQRLKNVLITDIINRDINIILAKYPLDKQNDEATRRALIDELTKYLEKDLPKEYHLQGIVPILFLDGGYAENGRPQPIPVHEEVRLHFIEKYSGEVNVKKQKIYETDYDGLVSPVDNSLNISQDARQASREAFIKAYRNYFGLLFNGAKQMLYREAEEKVQACADAYNNGEPPDFAAANTSILSLLQMLDVVKLLPRPKISGEIPAMSTDLTQAIKNIYAPEFYFDRYSYEYMSALADILNNLYWLGYNMNRFPVGTAGADGKPLSPENKAFYEQLMQMATDLAAEYKGFNATGWSAYYKLHGAIYRIELQERIRSTDPQYINLQTEVDELRRRQQNALKLGQREEYAYYRATEAFLCVMFRNLVAPVTIRNDAGNIVELSTREIFTEIINDSIVKQYEYIKHIVGNMQEDLNIFVEPKEPETPSLIEGQDPVMEALKKLLN